MIAASTYRLWVNDERTVLVHGWLDEHGEIYKVEVATRESSDHIWGPPVYLSEEKLP